MEFPLTVAPEDSYAATAETHDQPRYPLGSSSQRGNYFLGPKKKSLSFLALFLLNLLIWPKNEFCLVSWPFRQFDEIMGLSCTRNDYFAPSAE
jgi:hypothetical protein